jgi:hypothetical protein
VGASGDIKGTVVDSSGAMMPRANIIATETAKGVRRVASTDGSGSFLITGLEPATYDVSVQMTGFATEIRKSVAVAIGQTVILDFQLKVWEVATAIEVADVPPLVETQRAGQSDTVAERYIDDLPISRRDYLTFTLLMPGVSNSNTIADNADFRVKQTPQSGLSFYAATGEVTA